jgi:hypothetical protein
MESELPVLDRVEERYEDPLDLMDEIEALKKEKDATILAHYYVDGEIQDVADFVGDSLKLSRDAVGVQSSTIVFSGVHFMAETAKMLNPNKRVLIPDLLAGCSLAESCPYDKLLAYQRQLRAEGHDFETVAYINTTAAVKSLCDWIVTSGNAREIIERVPREKEILFVPDQHLGRLPGGSLRPQNDSLARRVHGARDFQPAGFAAGQEKQSGKRRFGPSRVPAEHSGSQRCDWRDGKDAEVRRLHCHADQVPRRDRSQHDLPAA